MKFYLGIDFGAENIMVSYIKEGDEGRANITFAGNSEILKNYYAIDNSGKEFFGKEAYNIYFDNPKNVQLYTRYKQDLTKVAEQLPSSYQRAYPRDILERMLLYIYNYSIDYIKRELRFNDVELERTVVTVPIGWEHDFSLRSIYSDAIKKAGFKNFRIVAEPIAAASALISSLKDHNPELAPKENDVILVVDMGASTLDISFIINKTPLEAKKGNNSFLAGNYCDALIAEKVIGKNVNEIMQNQRAYFDELIECQEFKEETIGDSRKFGKFKKDGHEINKTILRLEDIERITHLMVDQTIATILETIEKQRLKKIHHIIVCGGMCNFKRTGFLDKLYESLKKFRSDLFHDSVFLNNYESVGEKIKHYAICYGASLLSKYPDLINELLEYSIYIKVPTHKQDIHKIKMIESGIIIGKNSDKYSLLEKLRINKLGNSLEFHSDDVPFEIILDSEDGRYDSTEKVYIQMHESTGIIKNADCKFFIDENGILKMELWNLDNNTISGSLELHLQLKVPIFGIVVRNK